ncbi:MAG: hypothetical protein PHS98_03280 [Bacilli bacterium]|nr:hypothetical protein [Bacilli bacterium]
MAKKMKAIDVINSSKQVFSKKKIIVTDIENQEYELEIQDRLDESTLASLVSELTIRSEEFKKANIEFDMILNIYILILKHFTNIKFNNYKVLTKQIGHETELLRALINMNLLDQILNNFDENSIKDLEKLFDKYPKQMSQITENIAMEEVIEDADI